MDKELLKRELRKELARRSYLDYAKYTIPNFIEGIHHKFFADKIEKILNGELLTETGEKAKILCLSISPQMGKSTFITQTLPSFFIGKNPTKKAILISYSEELARVFGRKNREKINEFGQELFNIKFSKEQDTDLEIAEHKGTIISRGIMSGITGMSADLIVIDDPIKNRQEAESETYRQRLYDEFLSSIYTRLSANGIIVVIQTRWSVDDLIGRIMKELPSQAVYYNIPLEAEEDDILGRKVGSPLYPEIGKGEEWLKTTKQVYISKEGQRAWFSLFQGKPVLQDGNLIKREYFKFYSILPEKFDEVIQSWDMTFKDSNGSDYVVGQVWGRKGANKYLIDMVRERMDFVGSLNAVLEMSAKYPQAYIKLIEDKANGSAIISVLSQKVEGIMPITPKESKLARLQSVLPMLEAGNVYLPNNAIWCEEFINECLQFPNGKHDDMVDSMSQALIKMLNAYVIPEEVVKKRLPFALDTEEIENEEYMIW